MNYKDINIELIKCLSDNHDPIVRAQVLDDDDILLIPHPAYYGYIIPRKKLLVSESKLVMLDPEKPLFKLSDYYKPENEIKSTRNFFLLGANKLCRKFEGNLENKFWDVYIDEKFLKKCDNEYCWFYQNAQPDKDMEREPVLVVQERRTKDGEFIPKPILYLMPVEIRDW